MNHNGSRTSVFKQWNGIDGVMTFTTSNHIGESYVFYDVKFDHVTLRDTRCSWKYESHFSSIDSSKTCLRNVNIRICLFVCLD